MTDDTNTQAGGPGSSSTAGTASGAPAGYCQECGRGLTMDSLRRVGGGVFCEPCAGLRQSGAGWQNVHSGPYRPGAPAAGAPYPASGPNPVLAGLLGFIPGVGAMYNAQYAKGAMHLVVFVVLVAMADNLNWVLWWLVWGWIFYQVFDAYHTARARREHLPLPNPFGWNDIGDRMGFARPGPAPPPPQGASFGRNAQTQAQSQGTGANWAGYIPPKPPSAPPYSPFHEYAGENPYATQCAAPGPRPVPSAPPPPTNIGYVPTYTGAGSPPQAVPVTPLTGTRRFPMGALWLIGLGLLFLLGNLLPELRLSGRWFAPILLAALALWIAFRRWEVWQNGRRAPWCSTGLIGALTGPAVLLTVSALLALQTAHVLPMHRSWPLLLVVWGTMLLLQRSAAVVPFPERQPVPEPVARPVRSTSGTGSLGL